MGKSICDNGGLGRLDRCFCILVFDDSSLIAVSFLLFRLDNGYNKLDYRISMSAIFRAMNCMTPCGRSITHGRQTGGESIPGFAGHNFLIFLIDNAHFCTGYPVLAVLGIHNGFVTYRITAGFLDAFEFLMEHIVITGHFCFRI